MVTRKQTLPIAPGSFCLYPNPQPNHLAFIFSTSRRAHGGTQAINRSKSGGLCSFPPARSDKQNPGGSCPSSRHLRLPPSTAVHARKCLQRSACRLRVYPRTWISVRDGWDVTPLLTADVWETVTHGRLTTTLYRGAGNILGFSLSRFLPMR